MRIAVCFFGITRGLRQHTLASIENCLLTPVSRIDPGYKKFGHFNLLDRISNPRTGEDNVPIEADEFKLLNCDFISHTDQKQVDAEIDPVPIQKFGDCWEDGFQSLQNLLRQFYSLKQVTDLLVNCGQRFDLVIYSRADLRFECPVVIPRVRARTLYTAWFGKGGGLNDRFALGDFETMVHYGQRGSLVLQYCEETRKPLHAERFLLWQARKHGLRTADLTSIDFSRVRANGTIPAWDTIVKTRFKDRFNRALGRLKNLSFGHF